MVKRLMLSAVVSLVVALGAMVAGKAHAGDSTPPSCSNIKKGEDVAVYSVKFTCGQQSSADDDVVRGVYRTNINIHNPQGQTVNFCTKVVLPDNATPTGVTRLVKQTLTSDHALFIDCYTGEPQSIASQLANPPLSLTAPTTEFEGFVVIEVPQTSKDDRTNPTLLDVVGKYTARPGGSNETTAADVSSLQIVVYSPTLISNSTGE